jgi:DNA-3-methyladenine glycosylase I
MEQNIQRCGWSGKDPEMIAYHDHEWGVPVHDDQKLFEFVVLDGFQAGLSWSTILKKRENFRNAFDHFDPVKIVTYDKDKIQSLLENPGIIRNRLKIEATVHNARCFLEVLEQTGSFDKYLWSFVNYSTIKNTRTDLSQIPATSPESDAMSKDMKKRGFKFAGSTICYAFMQAAGLVNDHLTACFRYNEV